MLIGAHLSVSGGYDATVAYALEVGCECMQVFAKSPRQWHAKPLDADAAASFTRARAEAGLGPLFTHTAYLINLATDNRELRARSIDALAEEITRGRLLSAAGVVTHLGNDPLEEPHAAAVRVAEAIDASFASAGGDAGDTRLLLENTAGAGRTFGSSCEQLGEVLAALKSDVRSHVGVCLDTCHAHAYGIDLTGPEGWEALLDDMAAHCGPDAIRLVHANDCLFERGTRKDRHAWIGEGLLGEEAFRSMICCERLQNVCCVTEMPGAIPEKDSVNIARLEAMREACGAK